MRHDWPSRTAWLLAVLLLGCYWGFAEPAPRLVFSRFGPTRIGLFLADPDGKDERPLLPAKGMDYNPSFSADGKWILFTSERGGSADIFRVHPDGSGLEQLTEGPSYDDQGALSPDGTTLAFVSTREGGTANIWLLNLETRRYTNLTRNTAGNFRPSWSRDGQWLAFSSDRDTPPARAEPSWELLQSIAIYVTRADGSGLRRLTETGGTYGSPQWSRDGRHIVCYQKTSGPLFPAEMRRAVTQIVTLDVQTGAVRTNTAGIGCKVSPRCLDDGEIAYVQRFPAESVRFANGRARIPGPLHSPCWSPDRELLVYQKNIETRLGLMPAFSLSPKFELWLTEGWMPSYSPDGRQIVMTSPIHGRDNSLVLMKSDGSETRTILEHPEGIVTFPAWSPDGTQLAFSIGAFFDRPVRPGQLALIHPDGSGLRILTHGKSSSGFPSWSPDGKRLVFRVMGDQGQGLRILALDGERVAQLTTGYDTFPVWSPRGDRIAFCGFRNGNYDIYTVRPDGSDIQKLTDSHGNDAHPMWSPDGEWIAFSSSRKGFKDEGFATEGGPQPDGELFVMRADGTDLTQLTDNQWEDALPTWRPDVSAQKISTSGTRASTP